MFFKTALYQPSDSGIEAGLVNVCTQVGQTVNMTDEPTMYIVRFYKSGVVGVTIL